MAVRMKTTTTYDFEQLEELQRVASKTFAESKTKLQRGWNMACGIFCGCLGMYLTVNGYNAIVALLCTALGLWMLVRYFFFFQLLAWNVHRSMKNKNRENEFLFEEDHILARQKTESTKYPYEDCAHLLETRRNFYFIMESTGQGLMIDKTKLRGGSEEELRAFLEKKSGKTAEFVKVK